MVFSVDVTTGLFLMLLGEPSSSLMRQDTRSVRIVLDDFGAAPLVHG